MPGNSHPAGLRQANTPTPAVSTGCQPSSQSRRSSPRVPAAIPPHRPLCRRGRGESGAAPAAAAGKHLRSQESGRLAQDQSRRAAPSTSWRRREPEVKPVEVGDPSHLGDPGFPVQARCNHARMARRRSLCEPTADTAGAVARQLAEGLTRAAGRSLAGHRGLSRRGGGSAGRRAAVRGTLAIGVTSALVNVAMKSAWSRQRPDRAGAGSRSSESADARIHVVPVVPVRVKFPSGHVHEPVHAVEF